MATHPLAPRSGQVQHARPTALVYAVPAPTPAADELDAPDAWEAVQPVRPDTAHVRALRFLNATGELLSAVILVVGTIAGYGILRPF